MSKGLKSSPSRPLSAGWVPWDLTQLIFFSWNPGSGRATAAGQCRDAAGGAGFAQLDGATGVGLVEGAPGHISHRHGAVRRKGNSVETRHHGIGIRDALVHTGRPGTAQQYLAIQPEKTSSKRKKTNNDEDTDLLNMIKEDIIEKRKQISEVKANPDELFGQMISAELNYFDEPAKCMIKYDIRNIIFKYQMSKLKGQVGQSVAQPAQYKSFLNMLNQD